MRLELIELITMSCMSGLLDSGLDKDANIL